MAESALLHIDSTEDDPFRYGHRTLRTVGPDGRERFEDVPLELDDYLDPQEGDHMTQGSVHQHVVEQLHEMLARWFAETADIGVFSDLKMFWGSPGLSEPGPDIAVVRGLERKKRPRSSFSVPEEGARPCFVIEVVSPLFAKKDHVDKVRVYERAGIPEYLIVDPQAPEADPPFRFTGYRLDPQGRYRPWHPNAIARWRSETLDLDFSARPGLDRVAIHDALTGRELLDARQEAARADAEAARADAEAARADAEAARADAEAAARAREAARAEAEAEARRQLKVELARLKAQLQKD